MLKKQARSRTGFPLVGVTVEVSRADRRSLPQDDRRDNLPASVSFFYSAGLGSSSSHLSAAGDKN